MMSGSRFLSLAVVVGVGVFVIGASIAALTPMTEPQAAATFGILGAAILVSVVVGVTTRSRATTTYW